MPQLQVSSNLTREPFDSVESLISPGILILAIDAKRLVATGSARLVRSAFGSDRTVNIPCMQPIQRGPSLRLGVYPLRL